MCDTDLPLRREVALRLARTGGEVTPDEIVITNGCMDALNISLRAVAKPRDTVLVETPTYFGLLQMIESLGMKTLGVPSACGEGLDVGAFERALKKHDIAACVLIPSFGNPHGANLSEDGRQGVVDIARKHGVPIIEDDIYGELGFEDPQPRPLKSLPGAKDVLLCGSLSKSLSPALRVGWAVAGRHAENVRRLKWITSITTPHVTALAAADYLRSGGFDRHLRALRRTLETQMCRVSNAIARSFPQGTALSRPSGGYFLWTELPRHVDSLKLRDAAMEKNISICPGPIFSVEGEFRHFIRLNCALALDGKVLRAIETLGGIACRLNAAGRGKTRHAANAADDPFPKHSMEDGRRAKPQLLHPCSGPTHLADSWCSKTPTIFGQNDSPSFDPDSFGRRLRIRVFRCAPETAGHAVPKVRQ